MRGARPWLTSARLAWKSDKLHTYNGAGLTSHTFLRRRLCTEREEHFVTAGLHPERRSLVLAARDQLHTTRTA